MNDIPDGGRLEDHPFPALAGAIFREARSGELTLESDGRRRSVWFLGGNPVAVLSEAPQDHLAQVLLEHGKINADDARRLAAVPETREGIGGVDYLPKDTLNWGVKFRFVNLCYDLFRWEEGDYGFREGNPPKELFLLKVPAHSLIFKGVGYLGQGTLHDVVPDDAVCGPGPVPAADARYLGPDERRLLEGCGTGRTVAEALGEAGAGAEQARRTLYALSCLGLVSLSPAETVPPPAPGLEEDRSFFVDEPPPGGPPPVPAAAPAGGGFSLGGAEPREATEFTLPPLDFPCEPEAAGISPSDFIAAETLSPSSSFDQGFPGDAGDPFAAPATAEGAQPGPASGSAKPQAAAPKRAAAGRGFHLPRLAGVALGALGAAAVIGAAGWWWMSTEETPPPPVAAPARKRPQPPPPSTPEPPASAAPSAAPSPAPAVPAAVPAEAPPAVPAPPIAAPAVPAPPAAATAPADRNRNALEVFRAGDFDGAAVIWESVLAEKHRDEFTLLLMTACQHETIREAQRAFASRELYLVGKKVNGRNCFRVCLETFASREAAARALTGIPPAYRSAGAAVRPVSDVLTR